MLTARMVGAKASDSARWTYPWLQGSHEMPLDTQELVQERMVIEPDDRCFLRTFGIGSTAPPAMTNKWTTITTALAANQLWLQYCKAILRGCFEISSGPSSIFALIQPHSSSSQLRCLMQLQAVPPLVHLQYRWKSGHRGPSVVEKFPRRAICKSRLTEEYRCHLHHQRSSCRNTSLGQRRTCYGRKVWNQLSQKILQRRLAVFATMLLGQRDPTPAIRYSSTMEVQGSGQHSFSKFVNLIHSREFPST